MRFLKQAKLAGLDTSTDYATLLQQEKAQELLADVASKVVQELRPASKESGKTFYEAHVDKQTVFGAITDYDPLVRTPRNLSAKPYADDTLSPVDQKNVPRYLGQPSADVEQIYEEGKKNWDEWWDRKFQQAQRQMMP